MRPLQLSFQAFGPFASRETIDFESLGESPIFLINGPTGSGKSTILDAICFALYGETASKERDASSMRCQLARDDLTTEVELVFSLGKQQYRVKRIPAQTRPKKRGDGWVEHKPESYVWARGKNNKDTLLVDKGVKEASSVVSGLIGLDAEQFRQVIILPQGKFRELLLASSNERESIFSRLFQTHVYVRIESLLKQAALEVERASKTSLEKKQLILDDVNALNESDLDVLCKASVDKEKSMNAARKVLINEERALAAKIESQTLLASKFNELIGLQKDYQQLEARDVEYDRIKCNLEMAKIAAKIYPTYKKIQDLLDSKNDIEERNKKVNSELKAYIQEKTGADKNRLKAEDEADVISQKNIELIHLDKLESEITRAYTLKDTLNNAKKKISDITAAVEKHAHLQNTNNKAKEDVAKNIKFIVNTIESLSNDSEKLNLLKEKLNIAKKYYSEFNAKKLIRQEITVYQNNLNASKIQYKEANTILVRMKMWWHNNQAVLLATTLGEGQPCPVCGSENHPNIAEDKSENDKVSQADLEEHQRNVEDQKDNVSLYESKLAVLFSEDESSQKNLSQLKDLYRSDIPEVKVIEQEIEKHQASVLKLAEFESKKTNAEIKDKELDEKILRVEQGLKESNEKKQAISQAYATALANYQSALTRIGSIIKNIPNEDAFTAFNPLAVSEHDLELPESDRTFWSSTINRLISKRKTLISSLENELVRAREKSVSLRSAIDKHEAIAHTLQQQLEEKTASVNALNKEWLVLLNEADFSSQDAFHLAYLPPEEIEAQDKEVSDFEYRKLLLKTKLTHLEKDLAGYAPPDIVQTEKLHDTAVKNLQLAEQAWQESLIAKTNLDDASQKLIKLTKELGGIAQRYKVFGTLSELANGQNPKKLSLNRFVLGVLLDDVLLQATQRLHKMSRGRYQLLRKLDKTKGNKSSGLDLDVEDAFTGKVRSVSTLSGGESFMAALSLALGVSDVVQAYAGGIKLNALFIDEGFGSLDSESLDTAVRVLLDLHSSGRMVGIISHVSELKEQMSTRIDIEATQAGSRIIL